ncbi:hypothetical protein EYB26_002846 [Talaromyces marneffei]|uniref:uncharacterized protein n=1 Tax=Talaromyces marneffei TaxID=37727 RepID=UPI0012A81CCC|nr:uncharacterized protein EYB26_002846 [Talaromyces marneffei]QGA15190.1 hypothetical protein EYB26_002846 [Talaromyces marneffei]
MKLVTDFDCVSGCNICIYLSTSLIILIFWARSSSNIPEKHMLPRDHKHMDDQLHYNEALVFPGRTSHTRVLPKVHSFLYAFLIIAVPIRNCKSNWFAAIDNKTKLWWRRGWLQVDSPDHLHRGDDKRGLSHKLDQYLESKQYIPAKYPTVWLVTFLGYKSDQASFWYLYTAEGRLDLMIIEANNNFSERKVWVVPTADDHDTSGETTKKQRRKFRQTWSKEFHVSPFNSMRGFYSISTLDSFPPDKSLDEVDTIDITITLLTSQRRPKLVARVWSTSKPLVPSKISPLYGFSFFALWCLTGPLIQPRTLFQAFLLSQKHKLTIRDRPEPDGKVFPRHSTPAERCIREIFIDYLREIMNASADNFHIHLCDLSDSSIKINFSTPAADEKSPYYSMYVLTPKFYAVALTCPSINMFLHEAFLHKTQERRTAGTDATNPEAFIQLLKHATDSHYRTSGITDTQAWTFMISKSVISVLLWLVWPCVTLVRAIFLLKISGEGSNSSIGQACGSTKKQIDGKFFSHGDPCGQVKLTTDSGSFLDQYVHCHCRPVLILKYSLANLTTIVRERILSIVGGG